MKRAGWRRSTPSRSTLASSLLLVLLSSLPYLLAGGCSEPEADAPAAEAAGQAAESGEAGEARILLEDGPELSDLSAEAREQIVAAKRRWVETRSGDGASASRSAEAEGELGKIYLAYGFSEAAWMRLQGAVTASPRDFRWRYYLGHAYRQAGRHDEAIENLRAAVEIRPRDVPARVWLAELLVRQGDAAGAKANLQRALSLDADNAVAHFLRGQTASLEEDWTTAIAEFERVLALDPRASAVRYPLGIAYRHTGDLEAATRHFDLRGPNRPGIADPLMASLRELATGAQALLVQGNQAMKVRNFAEAIRKFREATAADPDNASARLNLGAALAQTGDRAGAITELQEAIRLGLFPEARSKASFNLGVLLEQEGRVTEAVERYRDALRSDQQNEMAQRRLDRLRSLGGRVPGASPPTRPDGG